MRKPKSPDAILTKQAALPQRCPACWGSIPVSVHESGGVTRLTCLACKWTERYRVTDSV